MPKAPPSSKYLYLLFLILGLPSLTYGIYGLITAGDSNYKLEKTIASWAIIIGSVMFLGSYFYSFYLMKKKQNPKVRH